MLASLSFSIRNLNRKRINFSRDLLLKTLVLLFDTNKRSNLPVSPDAPILVLRTDGKLGDSIVVSGFLKELKENNSNSRIIVVTGGAPREIYKHVSYIDEIIVFKKGALSNWNLYKKLHKNHFKYIINSTEVLKPHAAFLLGSLRAEMKISLTSDPLKSITKSFPVIRDKDHITSYYRSVLEYLHPKITNFNLCYNLNLEQSDLLKIKDHFSNLGLSSKFKIVVNSFAGTRLRNLSQKTTTNLIQQILLTNKNFIVITLSDSKGLAELQKWKKNTEGLDRWMIFPEFSSINENFCILNESDLIISPDTSIVHAAVALEKKLIALYRYDETGTNFYQWGPYLKDKSVFRHVFSDSTGKLENDINNVDINEIISKIKELS